MRGPLQLRAEWISVWILVCGLGFAAAEQPLPSADQVMQRVLERSQTRAAATNAPAWTYNKLAVMEKLDGKGKVEDRTEKLYRVQIIQGVPVSKLIKVEGRDLTPGELKKENQHDAALQKQVSGRDPKKAVAGREALITTNLAERFQFTALRRETIQGRQTVVITFVAKPIKGKDSIPDQILNRMAGTLWVDETTAEVARLEVHLTQELSLGLFGVLGTLHGCQMALLSKPMPDGTWLPEKTDMSFSARFVLSNVRFHMEETSDGYVLEPVPQLENTPGTP